MKKYFFLFALFIMKSTFSQISETKIIDSLINELSKSRKVFKTTRIIKKIEKQNPQFNDLYNSIKTKIVFPENVEKGFIEWEYKLDSLEYYCIVFVPKSYNPEKKYMVSFILHGAVTNLNPRYVNTYINSNSYNTDSLDKIIVYPASWMQSFWWENKQVKNISYILNRLKQTYNIDENNIHLIGISDGATGCFYQANKNITPWASIRPYIGDPGIVADLSNQPIYLKNFNARPFLIVNTDRDQLYPAKFITPVINKIKMSGTFVDYFIMKGFEHNIKWLPLLKDTIQSFVQKNYRNSYPLEIFWQTDSPTEFGRNHWLIIDKLKFTKNLDPQKKSDDVIYPVVFRNNSASGYVKLKVKGSIIEVETYNIKQYTLLLSPEQFDFNKPIVVYTNGILSFERIPDKDINVLLKWFSRDLDRTMLFGYELKVRL